MIVFPHIPKTGGTTMLNHFRVEKGADQVLSMGRESRVARFMAGKPQIEELDVATRRRVFCIQGHGVNENTILHAPPKRLKLMVVLREPDSHTRSRFNHRRSAHLKKRGHDLSCEVFMERFFRDDFQCKHLIKKFPSFIAPGTNSPAEQAKSILQKFDYVFLTSSLNEQFAKIAPALEISDVLHRKRITEAKAELDVPPDEILRRSPGDKSISDAIAAHDGADAPNQFNPFGFDLAGRDEAIKNIRAAKNKRLIHTAYAELASGLCLSSQAERVLYLLKKGVDPLPVNNPPLLRRLLTQKWKVKQRQISEKEQYKSTRLLQRTRRIEMRHRHLLRDDEG